ncbi:MAG: hypothetical protein ACRELX_04705 [Longimicrobiales bacterium]
MALWLAIALLALTVSSLILRIVYVAHARRRRARHRVVEEPNSHYNPRLVSNREDLDRWESIPLERVHEINRGEIERLIARAKAAGVESLRVNERSFLDHMALVTQPDLPADESGGRRDAPPPRPPQPPRPADLRQTSEARP